MAAELIDDRDVQHDVSRRLAAFAKELKRNPELDGLLREHGRSFGIAEGSRLDRVVQARDIDRAPIPALDLDTRPRMRLGPSLGM